MPLDLKCWEYRYVQPHSHYMSTSWGVGKGGVTTRTLGDNLTVSSFSPDRLQSWDLSCQVWSQTPLPTEPFLQYILSSLKTGFHFGMPHFICSTINRYRWFKILAELLDDMINLFKLFFLSILHIAFHSIYHFMFPICPPHPHQHRRTPTLSRCLYSLGRDVESSAGDWIQSFRHSKFMVYHWAKSQTILIYSSVWGIWGLLTYLDVSVTG